MSSNFVVTAYLSAGVTHDFPARNIKHAREIANRIILEGLWVVSDDGTESFYPTHQVYKVKVAKQQNAD